MFTYYIQHPNIDVTAEVEAPDTRHARTAFLDYLSRSGTIPWSQRQTVRKGLMTKRMEPGEIQTTVQLDYKVDSGREVEAQPAPAAPEVEEEEAEPEATDVGESPLGPRRELPGRESKVLDPTPQRTGPSKDFYAGVPIVDFSRRTGGKWHAKKDSYKTSTN